MLTFTQVALRRGTEQLFQNVSFTVHSQQKVGLIGANGAGKTSLFKMVLGELDTDEGQVERNPGLTIAHLAQEVPGTQELALQYVLGGDEELVDIQQQLAKAEADENFTRLAGLHEQLDAIDGYSAESRAAKLMAGLGFTEQEFSKPLAAFSGGWRIRLNLARTLMTRSDLLLLDEPTNHLDLDAIIWLVEWIRHYPGAMILISHDREFLDETVNHIAYLHAKQIELYTGNYSQFEVIKAARLAEQASSFSRQQREIAHMQDFVRRFRAKATKARQAQSRIKALERMELIAPAHVDSPFNFLIPAAEKTSDPLLNLVDAKIGYGEEVVLRSVTLGFHPGDRIGLLGHNGAGKSSLVKVLKGDPLLMAGHRHAGANLAIGYFSQHQVDELDLNATAFVHIRRLAPKMTEQGVRTFLGGFDFRGDKVFDPIRLFSGGEKARLALALVAFAKPNLLLMDEPTNHLDMEMRQALTIALQEFEGAIIVISHDRHLLANTVDKFLLVDDGSVVEFEGDLEDYRKFLQKPAQQAPVEPTKAKASKPTPTKSAGASNQKQQRQLKTQLRTLETRLARWQEKLEEVDAKLVDNQIYDPDQLANLQGLLREQAALKDQISDAEESWLTLSTELEALS